MLTKKRIKEYVKGGGGNCPYCDSPYIMSTEQVNVDGGQAWQEIKCETCGKRWTDVYKLVSLDEEE